MGPPASFARRLLLEAILPGPLQEVQMLPVDGALRRKRKVAGVDHLANRCRCFKQSSHCDAMYLIAGIIVSVLF
jgi:hypothetical protein